MTNLLQSFITVLLYAIFSIATVWAQYPKSLSQGVSSYILNNSDSLQQSLLKSELARDEEVTRRIEVYIYTTRALARKISKHEQYDTDEATNYFSEAYNKVSKYSSDIRVNLVRNNRMYFERELPIATADIRLFMSALIKPFLRKALFRRVGIVVAVQKLIDNDWKYTIGNLKVFQVSNDRYTPCPNVNRCELYAADSCAMNKKYFAHFIVFPGVYHFWAERQDASQLKIFNYKGGTTVQEIDYTDGKRVVNIQTNAKF